MFSLIKKGVFVFLLGICHWCSAQGLKGDSLIVIHSCVGKAIDSTEKKQYHLFPFYRNQDFDSAGFYKDQAGQLYLQTYFRDGSVKTLPFSASDFDLTRKLIMSRLNEKEAGLRKAEEENDPYLKSIRTMEREDKKPRAKNVVYAEVLGSDAPLSVNYERMLGNWEGSNFSARIAVSHFHENVHDAISLFGSSAHYASFDVTPVYLGGSLLTGVRNSHFEVNLGAICNIITNVELEDAPENIYKSYVAPSFQLAYRYQRPYSFVFVKIGLGILYDKYQKNIVFGNVIPMPGLALGLSF